MTRGTSGQLSFPSFENSDLSTLLASKLAPRLAMVGSMEYSQTWKQRATPAGRLYWEHTARGHRISGSDCSGWPTPNAMAGGDRKDELLMGGLVKGLTGWHTPKSTDGTKGGPNQTGETLVQDAMLTGWATPQARNPDAGNCDYERATEAAMGLREAKNSPKLAAAESSSAATANAVAFRLNPAFSRFLMQFPEGWDRNSPGYEAWRKTQDAIASAACAATETQSASERLLNL